MHNKVVYRIARGLRRAGCVVLRFNFRGVNLSEGVYDSGTGELDDARACLTHLRERYPELPFTLAGFSFGSRIALRLGCGGAGARRVLAAGFPTIYHDREYLERCTVPRIFIQSTHDQYGPVDQLKPFVKSLAQPCRLILIEARDHFFAGGLEELEAAVFRLGAGAGKA